MALRRKPRPLTDKSRPRGFNIKNVGDRMAAGLLVDDDLDEIIGNTRDP